MTRRDFTVRAAGTAFAAVLPSAAHGAQSSLKIPTQWDLTPLFSDSSAWESAVVQARAAIAGLGTGVAPAEDGSSLGLALRNRSDCRRLIARITTYAALRADVALDDGPAQEARQRADALAASLADASAGLDASIRRLGASRVEAIASGPGMARFRRTLRLTLAAKGSGLADALRSQASAVGDVYRQLSTSIPQVDAVLADGRTVRAGTPEYRGLRTSGVREERAAASVASAARLRPFAGTFATTLGAYMQARRQVALADGHRDVLASVLQAEGIPATVPTTMVAQARAGLPVLRRYVGMLRRARGVERLRVFELSPPSSSTSPPFTIERIRADTLAAVAPLGTDYASRFAHATVSGWMDCYPRAGKYAGGYTNYDAYDVHPYILLNLGNDYNAASTFAHEWGHAMHAMLAHAAQPFELAELSTFIAEVASTCHEQLLVRHLADAAPTPGERTFYLWQKALYQVGFFFRTAMQTEFEQTAHGHIAAGGGAVLRLPLRRMGATARRPLGT